MRPTPIDFDTPILVYFTVGSAVRKNIDNNILLHCKQNVWMKRPEMNLFEKLPAIFVSISRQFTVTNTNVQVD